MKQVLYINTPTDYLGSILAITDDNGNIVEETSYGPWGRTRDANTWQYNNTAGLDIIYRGYTGHEMLPEFTLINMNGRMYDPVLGRMLSPDNYVQDPYNPQNYNRYSYALNNPLKYTDPTGEFITWNIGNGGFSIGLNFTPVGVPLGFGINIGWGNGFSPGVYGEVGYRVGGTGLGSGVTVQQSLDYNFKYNSWSTTTSEGAYASFGPFNAGVNFSQTYGNGQWSYNWGVSAGVGIGNEKSGIGLNVGYGSSGWSYGLGGFYNPYAQKKTGREFYITDDQPVPKEYFEKWETRAMEDYKAGLNRDNSFAIRHYEKLCARINNPIGLDASGNYPQSRELYMGKHSSGTADIQHRGYISSGESVSVLINGDPSFAVSRTNYKWFPRGPFSGVRNININMSGVPVRPSGSWGVTITPTFDFRVTTTMYYP